MIKWSFLCESHEQINSSPTGPNGCDFADDVFRCIFLNWKFCVLIKISLYFVPRNVSRVQLTITQHWLRWWLGVEEATSHYLNQCWPSSLKHISGTRGRWLNAHYNEDHYWIIFIWLLIMKNSFYSRLCFQYCCEILRDTETVRELKRSCKKSK